MYTNVYGYSMISYSILPLLYFAIWNIPYFIQTIWLYIYKAMSWVNSAVMIMKREPLKFREHHSLIKWQILFYVQAENIGNTGSADDTPTGPMPWLIRYESCFNHTNM